MAVTIDGKAVARKVHEEVAAEVVRLGVTPGLATVLVGDDPASAVYVRSKRRLAERLGIRSVHVDLPADIGRDRLLGVVSDLNEDDDVDAILVQLPLPAGLDADEITAAIDPAKDADGLHPVNLGKLVAGSAGPRPCTPSGIMRLLAEYEIPLAGRNVVIVGRSFLVGRPLALMMSARGVDATVTMAHSRTRDLSSLTRRADVVVVAAGRPALIGPTGIAPGAAVIDVGVNRTESGLVGDVDPAVADVAGFLTPVPGGVGPMTVAMLMANTVAAARSRRHLE